MPLYEYTKTPLFKLSVKELEKLRDEATDKGDKQLYQNWIDYNLRQGFYSRPEYADD